MGKLVIKIDRELCQGHGVCMSEAPEVFRVTDTPGAYPQVELITDSPSEALRAKVLRAARYCPNGVIRVEEVED